MCKLKVYYGEIPLYVADLYQLCISEGYMYTLCEWEWFAHKFPTVESAKDFSETYFVGRRCSFEGDN